jgi:hypothetical protein
MRKLPQGIWTDTKLKKRFRFVSYCAKSRCYRIQYIGMWGMRVWLAAEFINPKAPAHDGRYTPPTAWDRVELGIDL